MVLIRKSHSLPSADTPKAVRTGVDLSGNLRVYFVFRLLYRGAIIGYKQELYSNRN